MDEGEFEVRKYFDTFVTPVIKNEIPNEEKIKILEKEIENLKTNEKANKFTKIQIQRNADLLKELFETIIKDDGFICGGFVRVCCSTKSDIVPSGDIDIYVKGKEQFESISKRLELNGYYEKRKSETARTMHYSFSGRLPIQLIMPLNEGNVLLTSENVEDILDNFDFTIARVGITKDSLNENLAIADVDFIKDDNNNHLNIKNIHCPIAQIYRVSKYMEKGFWCPMKQCLKIVKDWETRPDDYKNKILETVEKEDPTKEEIQELERLLHID